MAKLEYIYLASAMLNILAHSCEGNNNMNHLSRLNQCVVLIDYYTEETL